MEENKNKIDAPDNTPQDTPVDAPTIDIGSTPDAVNVDSEDDVFKNFMRRYGVIVAFVVIVSLGFIGITKGNEESTISAKERVSAHLNVGLKELKEGNYDEATKAFDKIIADKETRQYAISLYAEFLNIRIKAIKAQNKLAREGKTADTDIEAVLKELDAFISKHSKVDGPSKEVVYFAYQCKAALYDGLGKSKEAIDAFKNIDKNSVVYKLTKDLSGEAQIMLREELWKKFRATLIK